MIPPPFTIEFPWKTTTTPPKGFLNSLNFETEVWGVSVTLGWFETYMSDEPWFGIHRYIVFASVHWSCVCASELRSRAEAQYNLHPPPPTIYALDKVTHPVLPLFCMAAINKRNPLNRRYLMKSTVANFRYHTHTHTHITKLNKLGNKYKVQNSPNEPRLLYLVSKIRCPVSLHCWPLADFKNLLFLGYLLRTFFSIHWKHNHRRNAERSRQNKDVASFRQLLWVFYGLQWIAAIRLLWTLIWC